MIDIIELSVEFITETILLPVLAMYRRLVTGLRANSVGFSPTFIVSITELSVELITDTEVLP